MTTGDKVLPIPSAEREEKYSIEKDGNMEEMGKHGGKRRENVDKEKLKIKEGRAE